MKKVSCFLKVCLVLCLMLSTTNVASAATIQTDQWSEGEEVLTITDNIARSASWPTEAWDIATKGAYTGNVKSISVGYGVYTNYYFNCNANGQLRVTAELTAQYVLQTLSKCIFQVYDAVTKKLVAEYDPGYEAYDDTYISHTFTGLKPGTPYVVRFYNASGTTFSNTLSGPISVKHP